MQHARSYKQPGAINKGDIVYVDRFQLKEFFTNYHPLIANPYILLTHGGFFAVPEEFESYLSDTKLLAWFTKNCTIKHKKLKALPNGVVAYEQIFQSIKDVQQHATPWQDRSNDNLVYLNIMGRPDEHATYLVNFVKELSKGDVSNTKIYHRYLQELAQYKFTLISSEERDSHQVWEALLVGTVPVVLKSSVSDLYKDLPVVVVKEWSTVTESYLKRKITELSKKEFNFDKLTPNYWVNQMLELQRTYQ